MIPRTACFVCALLLCCTLATAEEDGRYPTPEQSPVFAQPKFITNPLDRAYPGVEYNIRPAVIGGTWPYRFTLKTAPQGMTIDKKTGTISWQAPQANAEAAVTILVSDQANRTAEQSFTITVTTAGFHFVSPDGDDANPGTFEKPWKTVMRAVQPVEDPANATLYLRGGTYKVERPASERKPNARNVLSILRTSPRHWLAWPGEKPVIDFGWSEEQWKAALATERAKRDGEDKRYAMTQGYGHRIWLDQCDDLLFDGLEVRNAAYYMFQMNDGDRSRLTWRRCFLHHLYGDGLENPAFIFGFAPERRGRAGFGNRPQAKPYQHLVLQECTLADRTPGHGAALVWYVTQGCLVEDCLIERVGQAICDKDNGWDNTYRNNTLRNDVLIAAQGCNDGINFHHNFVDGNLFLGWQPGWLRNVWVHHNAINGRVRLLGGGTQGPVEEIDAAGRKFAGPADPDTQAIVRNYPHDRRLIFAWANAVSIPAGQGEWVQHLFDRVPGDIRFAKRFRYVSWDGNLMDERAKVAIEWRGPTMTWTDFAKACGFDEHGTTGKVEFDADGHLPTNSEWREAYGRDSYAKPPEMKGN